MARRAPLGELSSEERELAASTGTSTEVIDRLVIELFALVEEAVAGATHALLAGDREAAQLLVAKDQELDERYRRLDQLVRTELLSGTHGPQTMRWLVALLSMLPELERSGDLAEHVAQRAIRGLPAELPARVRGLLARMGEVDSKMWRMAADAYADRADGGGHLDRLDDEMDDLHVELIGEIATGSVPVPVAIELALVGRFYERLGDHAVNITRRVPPRLRGDAGA